ncbi:ATP-binding SpoIIE family protein phosphatase [Actinomadura rubrisoli]|uniref:protein-serine/threonine phosphatase n=1 Tax=Actinomadura rubrisoli TaxID=2530368 RepID=A0A4V2YZ23_9ACTN|nr:SpoIIE family protein phosphatase [Actinomadura rubrisoli]TDD95467.1 GAF domain-containing protein [Actinomadura rubrisoli]
MSIAESHSPPFTGDAASPDGRPNRASGAETHTPQFLGQHLLGVARLAAITLDGRGRIGHWNHTAAEIFGVARIQAVGRPLAAVVRLPQEYRGAFGPEAFGHVWCDACRVPRVDNGELAEVGWWVYPIARPVRPGTSPPADGLPGPGAGGPDIRVLVLAADLRRLREDGPGLVMGDVLVARPDGEACLAAGARLLRVEPALAPPSEGGGDASHARRLAELLPVTDTAAAAITARMLGLGCPSVALSLRVRLPIVPYRGDAPLALRARPRAAGDVPDERAAGEAHADACPGTGAAHPTAEPDPRPEHGLETMAVREHLAFLGEAGQQIGSSLDYLQSARTLAEVLVPRLADFAAVELLEGVVADSSPPEADIDSATLMRRVAVVHNDEPGRWEEAVPEDEKLLLSERTPFVQAMRTGRAVHIPQVGPERARQISESFGERDLRPLFTGRALLIVPLIARGRVLGTFKLLRKPDRPGFDELDLALVEELGRRAALCIDNGRLYRREVQAAQELQRSMLPDDPPEVAGARVCYRYRPAGQAAQVGGDWFDAIPLPGCRLGIVVGDVMGHGLTSAAIMGQMRTAVRTLAAEDMRPARLLRQLDGLARRLGEDYLATCLYAVYDPIARRCRFASAGHVPPVLVSPRGESRVLPVPAGVPIGVGGEPFETMEIEVEDGSQLVLCTDGLLERRDRDIEQGLEEMRAQLAGASRALDGTCDALLETLGATTPADDIAIVAVGLDGIPEKDVARWELDPKPSMVPWARAEAAGTLADWRLGDLTDTVELLVSELVTNALVHGAGSIGLRLIKADDVLLGEVYDDGQELPQLCHAEATDESGRGLQLVSHLAERWGTHRTENGKVVWFEHHLPGRRAR